VNGIDDQQLMIDIISDDKPCIVNGAENQSYLTAIMPMRV
jgi:DNA polymerase III sliding clamp (beta) subunit (PCNA family)